VAAETGNGWQQRLETAVEKRLRSGKNTNQAQNKMGMRPTTKTSIFSIEIEQNLIQSRMSSSSIPYLIIEIKFLFLTHL
jgi:hypothetical protein